MRNIKLIIQYDGTDYSGWQIQRRGLPEDKTIQGVLQDAIASVTGERLNVIGAVRTDAGVHAIGQVASFRTQSRLDVDTLHRAINARLPRDIRVIGLEECPLDFHPRYSAKGKSYFYIISKVYSIFLRRYSWHIPHTLNCDLMREVGAYLIGEHDFSSFRAAGCGSKNPVRMISYIEISEFPSVEFMAFNINTGVPKKSLGCPAPVIKISISANAFLRHMVRNIVGTLVQVGRGKVSPSRIVDILRLKDRRLSGPTAPAKGLFLERVIY